MNESVQPERPIAYFNATANGCIRTGARSALAFVTLLTACVLGALGLIRVARENPTAVTLTALATFSVLMGYLLGAVSYSVRGRVVALCWDARGVRMRCGLRRPQTWDYAWSQLGRTTLYLLRRQAKGRSRRAFLLVVNTPIGEMRLDHMQAPWSAILPLLGVLEQKTGLTERDLIGGVLDQGPSLRHSHG